MTIEKFRELRHAKPFQPFLIRLRDGEKVKVREAFNLALSQRGTYVVVLGPAGAYHHIDLKNISDITLQRKSVRGGKR